MAWFQNPWVVMLCVVAGLVVLAVLSRVAGAERQPVSRSLVEQTETLLRSANKWAAQAEQDNNPVVGLMDSCHAKAYVLALRRIMDDDQMMRVHNVNMRELLAKMDKVQQAMLARLSKVAPQVLPQGEFAVRTGWLG